MKIYSLAAFLLLASCYPQVQSSKPVKLDFSCIATPQGERLILECADPETWKEWLRKQST